MDVHQTHHGNYFMMFISQIMLCALQSTSTVCQLYVNCISIKLGEKVYW